MSRTEIYNALNNAQEWIKTGVGNVSNSEVTGSFKVTGQFIARRSGSSYVERPNYNVKGAFVQTGVGLDLSIGSGTSVSGLFVIKGENGEIYYTPDGSIRETTDGEFCLADKNSRIMGWNFASDGKLPSNISTTSALVPISLKGVTSRVVPTTNIGLIMNLDQSQQNLLGAGGKMNPNLAGILKIAGIDSIIVPNDVNTGALHYGDQFRLKAGNNAEEVIFEYGGIASSKKIDSTSTIFKKINKPGDALPISDTAGPNELSSSYKLMIAMGGNGGSVFTFSASNLTGQTSAGAFSSVTDLAAAINATGVGGLKASIVDGRLSIAGADANQSLTFTENVGTGASLIKALGIDNVPDASILSAKFANNQPVYRFSTMHELQQKINSVNQGLKATISGTGINFSSKNPLEQLQLGARSINARSIYTVTAGFTPVLPATFGVWTQNTVATIQASNNFLKAGDYVRLSGGNGPLGDGIYKIMKADADSFVVATKQDLAAANIGDPVNGMPVNGSFTWQKVDGGNVQPTITGTAAATTCDTAAVVGTASFVGLAGIVAAQQLAAGDVVYVQNSNSIQNGYYRVSGPPGGNTLDLTITGGGNAVVAAGDAVQSWTVGGNTGANFLLGGIGVAAAATAAALIGNPGAGAAITLIGNNVPSIRAAVTAAWSMDGVAPNSALVQDLAIKLAAVRLDAVPNGAISMALQGGGLNQANSNAIALTIFNQVADAAPGGAAYNTMREVVAAVETTGTDIKGVGHDAAPESNALTITKVAGQVAFESFPLETTLNSQTVKVHMTPGTSYAVNSVIAFRNLANTPLTLGTTLSITGDKYYKITAVDPATGTVSFDADLIQGGAVGGVTAEFVGFNAKFILGNQATSAAGTILGANAYIDSISDTFNALGLTVNVGQGQSAVTADVLNIPLSASYSATDITRNFAGGKITDGVFKQTISVVDNVGESHDVILAFGKTGENEWSAEVYLPKNEDGGYDAVITNQIAPGLLVNGKFTFDGKGNLTSLDGALAQPIRISWNNGATTQDITFDYGALNGLDPVTGLPGRNGVTQINGNGVNNVTSITNDGVVPGGLTGYYIDDHGILFGQFAEGAPVKIAQLAIATFANYNGLMVDSNGHLRESADSGQVLLKLAGTAGVASIVSGGVAGSATDGMQELTENIAEGIYFSKLLTTVAQKEEDAIEFMLNRM